MKFLNAHIFLALELLTVICAPLASAAPRPVVNQARPVSRPVLTAHSAYLKQLANKNRKINLGVAYWIELNRQGILYRTNNKAKFKSGDQIRFHLISNDDAYAYIVLRQGTKGTRSVLFPLEETGRDNLVKRGRDCVVPTQGALQFDEVPGIENVALLLSRKAVDPSLFLNYPANKTAFVAGAAMPAKHKLPQRTKMVVEPAPNGELLKAVDIEAFVEPGQAQPAESPIAVDLVNGNAGADEVYRSASALLKDSNMVLVVGDDPAAVVSVNISLIHDDK
jgi:hypothetical protein